MRTFIAGTVAVALLIGGAQIVVASCADDDPDGSLTAAARTTAEQNCEALGAGCTSANSHGAYVSCIAHQAKALSSGDSATLPTSCKGAVKRCAAKSVCGKQARGFVTCCVTDPTSGETRCSIKHSTDQCTSTVGTCGSCCDACSGGTGPTCPAG